MNNASTPIYCADVVARYGNGRIVIVDRLSSMKGFALPGGKQEGSELLSETAIREFREETGLEEITVGDAIDVRISDDGTKYVVTFWCIARGTPAITLSFEHEAYAWVALEELDDYPFWHPSIPERIRAASEF